MDESDALDPAAELGVIHTGVSEARAAIEVGHAQTFNSKHVKEQDRDDILQLLDSAFKCVQLAEQKVSALQREHRLAQVTRISYPEAPCENPLSYLTAKAPSQSFATLMAAAEAFVAPDVALEEHTSASHYVHEPWALGEGSGAGGGAHGAGGGAGGAAHRPSRNCTSSTTRPHPYTPSADESADGRFPKKRDGRLVKKTRACRICCSAPRKGMPESNLTEASICVRPTCLLKPAGRLHTFWDDIRFELSNEPDWSERQYIYEQHERHVLALIDKLGECEVLCNMSCLAVYLSEDQINEILTHDGEWPTPLVKEQVKTAVKWVSALRKNHCK